MAVIEQLLQRTATDLGALALILGVGWRYVVRPAITRAQRELVDLVAATVAAEVRRQWAPWKRRVTDRVGRVERELASLAAVVYARTEPTDLVPEPRLHLEPDDEDDLDDVDEDVDDPAPERTRP